MDTKRANSKLKELCKSKENAKTENSDSCLVWVAGFVQMYILSA